MKNKITQKFNKKKLLREICDVYGYEIIYDDEHVTLITDEDILEGYENIDLALISWLDTLIESELEYRKDNVDATWIEEIDYIKNIKSNLMFDKNFKGLEEHLVYGQIPTNFKKNLSVYLKERIKNTDRYMDSLKRMEIKSIKAFLLVEFVMKEDELKYIKIENEKSLERVIFEGDTSEIEPFEKDVYNKNGIIENMPLLPVNNISKFGLNIPVALTVTDNTINIQNPINYLDLF